MDRVLISVADWARRLCGLLLLVAGLGAISRYPGLNLFLEQDEVATWLRLCGGAIAIITGVVSLIPRQRVAWGALLVFLQFLFFASIFSVVAKSQFAKTLVLAVVVAAILEEIRRSRTPAPAKSPDQPSPGLAS